MTSPSPAGFDTISAVRLRLLTRDEWASILSGDARVAARWVHAAAHHGFRAAQVTWGQMLLDGCGIQRDPDAAYRWFRRAAEIGSIDGINMVGRCHELGWGATIDHVEAMRWYEKAAAKSSDWGQYNLASMFLYGEGVGRSYTQALRWYVRAAMQGHVKAMGMVGRFHEEGWEVQPNLVRAMYWYRRAATGGDFWGQYHLARLLVGSRPDHAIAWLRRAIEGGTHNFLRSVGPALLDQSDVRIQDIGLRALERCCESGDSNDFEAYGRALSLRGRHEEATLWLRRPGSKGHHGKARSSRSAFSGAREPSPASGPMRVVRSIGRLLAKRTYPRRSLEGTRQ